MFVCYLPSSDLCVQAYNKHVAEVKAHVPPDKLLVFNVKEGWGPLCKFLNKPVPAEPFPHLNEGADDVIGACIWLVCCLVFVCL